MRTGARAASTATAAAVLAGALIALPAASAAPPVRLWRVTRVRADRAIPLNLRAVVKPGGSQWAVLVVAVRVTGGTRTATPVSLARPGQEPVLYDRGTATRPCPGCGGRGDGAQVVGVQRSATSDDFMVSVRDAAATVTASAGWRVREVPPTALRMATAERVTATGAAVPVAAVERFTAASLPGGRYGSLAWLVLSCGTAGVGSVALHPSPRRKGDGTATASCDERRAGASAATSGAVTWRAEGDAVGAGAGPSLLLVLDLPRN